MKIWKKIFGHIMVAAVLITEIVVPQGNVVEVKAKDYGISNPRVENGVTTWDKIKFGKYYQDAEFIVEPVKWRILDIDESNNALLIADKNLSCMPYHDKYEDITWETCTLRRWLNNDFYNEAFDAEEKKSIIETDVVNNDDSMFGEDGGNDTKDKVYLLSNTEAHNQKYGFDTDVMEESSTRIAKNTDNMWLEGCYSDMRIGDRDSNNGVWWLRTPGYDTTVHYVDTDGFVYVNSVTNKVGFGVRPVIHVNLSSPRVMDAGEVDSEGNETTGNNGFNIPVVEDGVTTWDCVYFGRYKQKCEFEKQDIEWRVLSVDGDTAVIIADKNLDVKVYNPERTVNEDDNSDMPTDASCIWETSTLRKWLNSEFCNEAFNTEEQASIIETDIKDKVSLLSMEEACKSEYGFDNIISIGSDTRKANNSDYSKINGALNNYSNNGAWWLCSFRDENDDLAEYVNEDGSINNEGIYLNVSYNAVRPVLHINLASYTWSKVGEVCANNSLSQGVVEHTASPTVVPTPTKQPDTSTQASAIPIQPPTPADPTQPPAPTTLPQQTAAPNTDNNLSNNTQLNDSKVQLKTITLSSVVCKKGAKKITGKVSVSGATVKIKVGSKAYKKAAVKGKKFTLKVAKLKKKTKVTIAVTKAGYKKFVKVYMVK